MTFPEPRAHNHTNTDTQEEICTVNQTSWSRPQEWDLKRRDSKTGVVFPLCQCKQRKIYNTEPALCEMNKFEAWLDLFELESWWKSSVHKVLHPTRNMQSTGAAFSDHLLPSCTDLEPSRGLYDAALKQKARWFLAPGGCRRCFWRFHQSVTHHAICHFVISDHHFFVESFRALRDSGSMWQWCCRAAGDLGTRA